jgi:hypothetical protein
MLPSIPDHLIANTFKWTPKHSRLFRHGPSATGACLVPCADRSVIVLELDVMIHEYEMTVVVMRSANQKLGTFPHAVNQTEGS